MQFQKTCGCRFFCINGRSQVEGYCFWCNFDKYQKETRVTCLVLCTCEFSTPIFTLGIKQIPPPSQTVNSAHHLSVSCRICFLTFIPNSRLNCLKSLPLMGGHTYPLQGRTLLPQDQMSMAAYSHSYTTQNKFLKENGPWYDIFHKFILSSKLQILMGSLPPDFLF